MAVSMKNVDVAFQGVGGKPGTEIWRIEIFSPVLVPKSEHGNFYSGDSYIVLRTTALKSGAFHYDLHFWLGKDTSQDEAGAAAIKTVELDAALGGRAVQYRESQGHETDLFLSYFKPCIVPLEGGVKSGFKKIEPESYETRLFMCRGTRVARVTQVPFARQSLSHNDVFILDTKTKIYQFNGANSNIQERGKALEVVQHLKDTYHDGTCTVVIVDDGKLGAESDAGEFWGLFGGFAPLGKKSSGEGDSVPQSSGKKLFCVVDGKLKKVEGVSTLKRDILDTHNDYLLDCGIEIYIWNGRDTSLDQRKAAILSAEEFIASEKRPPFTQVIRIIEGFETPQFKALFEKWPVTQSSLTEDGRGKVAALLKQQGLNVKGILKRAPTAVEAPLLLDDSGKLEVWRVDGNSKVAIPSGDYGKFFDAHCYIVLYTYHGERKEEYFLCNWLGERRSAEDESDAFLLSAKIANNLRGRAVQAIAYQGKEPAQFLPLFPCVIIFKGNYTNELRQEATYLLRVDGTASFNSRTVFVEPVATSLNSSDCFILLSGKLGYTWYGTFSTSDQQKLPGKITSFLKVSTKPVKEGSEPSAFWNALGGKQTGYPAHRDVKDISKDAQLFHCNKNKETTMWGEQFHAKKDYSLTFCPFLAGDELRRFDGKLEMREIFNFGQDDLLTEDVMIMDTHSALYVWVGQHASTEDKKLAFDFAKEYLDGSLTQDGVSLEIPVYRIPEGFEPTFFTACFEWNTAKASVHENSYLKRLAAFQGQKIQAVENTDDNSATQRKTAMAALNSVFTPENAEPSSPHASSPKTPNVTSASSQRAAAMAALNSVFTPQSFDPNSPEISTPKSASSQRAAAMAALSSVLVQPTGEKKSVSSPLGDWITLSLASKFVAPLETSEGGIDSAAQAQDLSPKAGNEESGSTDQKYSYERLKVSSTNPIPGIDAKKRESYLSPEDFVKLLGVGKDDFYELPKWKQDQRKRTVDLF